MDVAELLRRIRALERGHEELDARCQASEARLGAPLRVELDAQGDAVPEADARDNDRLIRFFKTVKALTNNIMRPLLLNDAAFYVAIFMVVQWHVRHHLGELIHEKFWGRFSSYTQRQVKPMMTLRRLGINILIFGIYYDRELPLGLTAVVGHRQFVSSLVLVFVDAVFLYYAFMALGILVNPRPLDESKWVDPLDEDMDDGMFPDKLEASNIYEDLVVKLRRVTPVWFVQMLLTTLYIEELNENRDTKQLQNVDFIYWIVAVVFQMHAGEKQVGEAHNPRYWNHVLNVRSAEEMMEGAEDWVEEKLRKRVKVQAEEPLIGGDSQTEEKEVEKSFDALSNCWHKVFWVVGVKFWYEWQVRRFMDWSVNSMARSIILYTVPIMVSVEGPLDFVKDLTAVMFITTLDDIEGDPRDAKEILAKLKFGVRRDRQQGETHGPSPPWADLSTSERSFVVDHPERFKTLDDLHAQEWRSFCGEGEHRSPHPAALLVWNSSKEGEVERG